MNILGDTLNHEGWTETQAQSFDVPLDEKMDLLKFTNEQRCSKHDSKSEANVVKTIFAHVRK